MKQMTVILALLAVVLLSACGQAETAAEESQGGRSVTGSNSYGNISAVELKSMLGNKDFLLINVHIPYAGDIPDTDLSIPYNEITTSLDQLPEDRKAKIVLYCAMGPMSDIAAGTLAKQGYTNITTLTGGMMAWERQNFPLER